MGCNSQPIPISQSHLPHQTNPQQDFLYDSARYSPSGYYERENLKTLQSKKIFIHKASIFYANMRENVGSESTTAQAGAPDTPAGGPVGQTPNTSDQRGLTDLAPRWD